MRAAVVLVLLPLVALTPTAPAGYGRGGTVGVDHPFGDAGVWDLWYFDAAGGFTGLSAQWTSGAADYDVYLYPPGSLDDGWLDEPPVAMAEARGAGPAQETIWLDHLAPGRYVVAVIPHDSTGAPYDLYANPGALIDTYPGAVGVRWDCPPAPVCPR